MKAEKAVAEIKPSILKQWELGEHVKKKLKEEQQMLIEINAKLKLQFEAANKAEYELRTPVEQNKKETQTKTNTNKDLVAQALEYESKHSF